MKISIAGSLALLTLAAAMAAPAHAAVPAAVAPRTTQTPKPTPSPKPAAGRFSAGQETRIDSQRSRQQFKPQATNSHTCTGGTCESPGARSAQGTGRARASKPGEPSTSAGYIKFDGIDGEFQDVKANQKTSELDQSTPILYGTDPNPRAGTTSKGVISISGTGSLPVTVKSPTGANQTQK